MLEVGVILLRRGGKPVEGPHASRPPDPTTRVGGHRPPLGERGSRRGHAGRWGWADAMNAVPPPGLFSQHHAKT